MIKGQGQLGTIVIDGMTNAFGHNQQQFGKPSQGENIVPQQQQQQVYTNI